MFKNTELWNDILELVKVYGIELTIERNAFYSRDDVVPSNGVYVTLNTGAKSEAHLCEKEDGEVVALGRYNEMETINGVSDILSFVYCCIKQSDPFIASGWQNALASNGYIRVEHKTVENIVL
jgi:hypothetical protein